MDPEGHWDFSQVSDRFSGRFVRNTATEPNFGFTSSTIWLRFTLDTSRVRGQSWYLVERYPILDHISLFAPTEDGGYRRVDLGDTLPFDQRLMDHRAFIFPLDTDLAGANTYYVRVSGKGAINLSPMLYSAAGLVEYTYRDILLYGVFYGCLLIMVVYNAVFRAVPGGHHGVQPERQRLRAAVRVAGGAPTQRVLLAGHLYLHAGAGHVLAPLPRPQAALSAL